MYSLVLQAQFTDYFSDNNFTTNPTWQGNTDSFEINNQKLHLNAPANSAESYLITPSLALLNAEWEFTIELGFNPSNSNKARVYLTADTNNLKTNLNGYFVEIGSSDDNFKLRKQTGNTTTILIDGADDKLAFNQSVSKVKVTRDAAGNWALFTDTSSTLNHYVNEGNAFDNTHTNAQYFGVFCDYTATRSDKFWFDNFTVTGQAFTDVFPPQLLSYAITQSRQIVLVFSEEIQAPMPNHFVLNGNINPSNIQFVDSVTLALNFEEPFTTNSNLSLYLNQIKDTANNTLADTTLSISYHNFYAFNSVLITEIMAIEAPSQGLPETEYFELYNNTNQTIYLADFRLEDLNDTTWFGNDSLLPNEYAVVVPIQDTLDYNTYLKTIGLPNWLLLGNTQDQLTLYDKWGNLLHQVNYHKDWYNGAFGNNGQLLSDGGVSLEMKDVANPCGAAENWAPSPHGFGGTPGAENSVKTNVSDSILPDLYRISYIDSVTVLLHFSEAVNASNLSVNNYNTIYSVGYYNKNLKQVLLTFTNPIADTGALSVVVQDCAGNTIGQYHWANYQKPATPNYNELIINEVLFNPKTDGSDFVEIFNTSHKCIDITGFLFQKLDNDTVSDVGLIETPYLQILPNQYFVFTENKQAIINQYMVENPGWLIETNLPNYADDAGEIRFGESLTNNFDSLQYNKDWHFELLNDNEGVSLERISAEATSQNQSNWHSASKAVGFATPTYKNSQNNGIIQAQTEFSITPQVISPNNDGYNDFTLISYQGNATGKTATITIFDVEGRTMQMLTQNELLGNGSTWKWNGLNQDNELVNIGIYIVFIEVTNVNGTVNRFKEKVVVGARF